MKKKPKIIQQPPPPPNLIALGRDKDGNAIIYTDLITKKELMQLLKLSERTIDNWREKGTVASTKIGGCIFFFVSDINRILNENIRKKKNTQDDDKE